MKVQLNHMFTMASGKLCKKESTYIAYNKKTGNMYSAEYHDRDYPNTEKQQTVKTTFTSKSKVASEWWNANKPTTDNAEGTEAYQAFKKKYDAQSKIGNPYSYLRTLVKDDLTISLGSSSSTGTGGTTTPSGDSDSNTQEGA